MRDANPTSKAMFVDEVDIFTISGDGGAGCMSFRREKFVPRGGPDGGDGGNGGSVYLQTDDSYNTLQHLAGHHHWRAKRGEHGRGKNMHGRRGEDIVVLVPPGTIVLDAETQVVLKDLTEPDERICVAVGGHGGRGNTRFKTATHQAPREFEPGQPGQTRHLNLQLKLIADAGLVGKPNAGKSTLISRLSAARPKVASYPFTTLNPCLGIVELAGYRRLVMADIPGLIEGAHKGAGLGDEFLRHIERTTVLVHIVDLCPPTGNAYDDYVAIRRELEQYSPALAIKSEIVVANKTDLTGSDERLRDFQTKLDQPVFAISAATGQGLEPLAEAIWQSLHPSDA